MTMIASHTGRFEGTCSRDIAIAVLFALRERLGGYAQSQYLLPDRRESYGLSHDTWTRGSRELEDNGLLTVSTITQGEEYAYTRRRRNYWLNMALLDMRPIGHRSAS
jgi:hypothetical protein